MKKLSSILVVMFSVVALMFGLYGCSNTPEENYWLAGEKTTMSLLEVDIYTPVENATTIDQYFRWKHIEGGLYTVKADGEVLYSSNANYTIKPGEYVEIKIPDEHKNKVLSVSYKLADSQTELTPQNEAWKIYVWNNIEKASYYRVVTKTNVVFTSEKDKYNRTQDSTLTYNSFEITDTQTIFRTTPTSKDSISKIQYVEEAEKDTYNKFFTRLDSSMSQLFNGNTTSDTNAKIAIEDTTSGNIYRVIETKYLYLIRSCFVNVWEYGKLLETVPPTETEDNAGAISNEFKDLNNKVLNLQETLNSIKEDFDSFKKYFVTFTDTPEYLKDYNTAHGAQLRKFEESITPKIEKIIDFSEYFQTFCEKHYNVVPNVSELIQEAKTKATDSITLNLDNAKYNEELLKLFSENKITGSTIKNTVIAYQNKLLRPIYNYYFKEYEGKYSTSADERLFDKLVAINNQILKKTTTLTHDVAIIENAKLILNKLDEYFKMKTYLDTEREIFLKGLENVELNEVKKVDWTLTSDNYEWTPVEDGKTCYVLIKLNKNGEVKYDVMHNLITKEINGKDQLAVAQIKSFLQGKYTESVDGKFDGYTATYELYSIKDDAFVINYNDRIISYLNETIYLTANYTNTINALVTDSVSTTLFYNVIDRLVIVKPAEPADPTLSE